MTPHAAQAVIHILEHGVERLVCVDAARRPLGVVTRAAVAARLAEGGAP